MNPVLDLILLVFDIITFRSGRKLYKQYTQIISPLAWKRSKSKKRRRLD